MLPIHRNGFSGAVETTLEREYVLVLMQDFMNGGQFPPDDAFWISRRMAGWCQATKLGQPNDGRVDRFIVDPHGDAGLARSNGESPDTWLCFDLGPVRRFDAQGNRLASGCPFLPSEGPSPGRARKLAVLTKLSTLCAAERPVIARRGKREPTAATVEVVMGMSRILRVLRQRPDEVTAQAPRTR